MKVSKLQIYGLGIVGANKALSSKMIEVLVTEDHPMVDGEISDNTTNVSSKGNSADGASYETSINTTITIQAEWLELGGSNRVTAPDVRRGERVVIYRFADVDKYYWITQDYDMQLRKLETVIFAFTNTRDESLPGKADNTYFFEISTHKKLIHLHTSKSDGEPYVYDIQLNTKDGSFMFQDDIGNYISFDSKNIRLEMKNAVGSWIDMDRKNITIYAPDTINLKADNQINLSAGNSINHNTTHINTQATDTNNAVPSTTNTGNVLTSGTTTTSGLVSVGSGGGKGPIDGSVLTVNSVEVAGNGHFSGTVTAASFSP